MIILLSISFVFFTYSIFRYYKVKKYQKQVIGCLANEIELLNMQLDYQRKIEELNKESK